MANKGMERRGGSQGSWRSRSSKGDGGDSPIRVRKRHRAEAKDD